MSAIRMCSPRVDQLLDNKLYSFFSFNLYTNILKEVLFSQLVLESGDHTQNRASEVGSQHQQSPETSARHPARGWGRNPLPSFLNTGDFNMTINKSVYCTCPKRVLDSAEDDD